MNKNKFKAFIIILFTSLVMLVSIPFFSRKIHFITLFSFIGYFYLTLIFIKVFSKKLSAITIVKIIFVTMLLLQTYTIFAAYVFRDLFALPTLIVYCLGVISAYYYQKKALPKNLLVFTLSCCFVVFMFFRGQDYWTHKIDYGTFTGEIQATNLPTKFEAFDERKTLITDVDLRNKIVLMDFWTTTCGVCFQKFPQVQSIYNRYKNDDSVKILAVNNPIEEDKPNQAFDNIRKEGHRFPVVVAKDENLAEKFGVKGYPTTFVINPNGQIVYKGGIEGAVKMVDELKLNQN